MARDILGEYGPERSMGSRGSNQGRDKRDVMNYSPPKGPTNINDAKSPGLHGDNEGTLGEQNDSAHGYERHQSSGGPGIGGSPKPSGSQGRH